MDPRGGDCDFKFFHSKKAWINCFRLVCVVVSRWDGFDWDWGDFSDVRSLDINALSKQDFRKTRHCLMPNTVISLVMDSLILSRTVLCQT